jgi:hypothetical protein
MEWFDARPVTGHWAEGSPSGRNKQPRPARGRKESDSTTDQASRYNHFQLAAIKFDATQEYIAPISLESVCTYYNDDAG